MQNSSIEWTECTWNPIRGCTEVSPGCDHCYARTFAERFRGVPGHPYEQGFDFRIVPHKLIEPLQLSKQRRIFVNSMSDIFYGENPEEYIRDIADIMLTANWHVYQILTKRSTRMKRLFNESDDPVLRKAAQAPHILWGVSAEDHKHGEPRIKELQETHVRNRWVSFEPLLEDMSDVSIAGMKWSVVGGESGRDCRMMESEWALNMQRQAKRDGVPFLFKQWGGVHKKKTGRTLNDRTYDEMPHIRTAKIPNRKDRNAIINDIKGQIRERWATHALSKLEQWMKTEEKGENAYMTTA